VFAEKVKKEENRVEYHTKKSGGEIKTEGGRVRCGQRVREDDGPGVALRADAEKARVTVGLTVASERRAAGFDHRRRRAEAEASWRTVRRADMVERRKRAFRCLALAC
jgi:hypothetical protein